MKQALLSLVFACVSFVTQTEDLVAPAQTQTYGFQEVGPNIGGFAARKPENYYGGFHFTVGVQSNGVSRGGSGIVWGLAAEASASDDASDWLVGVEAGVVSANSKIRWITANNAVISCRTYDMLLAGIPCSGPNNVQSRAYWVSAQEGTGFESGLKFDVHSLFSMPGRPPPTVIDVRDVPAGDLKGWCIIATATRCITIDDLNKL